MDMIEITETNYPYKRRQDRADPRRKDDYYILTCAYCDQPTKHTHSKDRVIPYKDIDGQKGQGNAIDHIFKCTECGSVRRWGLSTTQKVKET